MKIERTKNASRNILFGIILRLYTIVVPFIMRTAMIYSLGIQYLGLNSLFTSLLQVLNLAELGVGTAMVYSMYKPIAEDDYKSICALMKLYRTYYRVIGLIIAGVGLLVTPFIPHLISGDVPEALNIYTLYLINLGATVLSYWLFAYKNSILQANQRIDVISKVTIFTTTAQYGLQLIAIWIFHNYYYYVIVLLISQVLNNVITAIYANKLYPNCKPEGNVDVECLKQINGRIRDLVTSKVGAVIYDSADSIVISSFLGLTILAIYQNYFYIITAVSGFLMVIFTACTAGIGNSLMVESQEKNYRDLNKITFIICWISGFCSVCLLCIYQPFMEIWVGENLMLEFSAVICFVVYFFVKQLNSLFNMFKDAAGMWHEDRFRPLVAALINLVLNLILVRFIGIYGVIFSTVLAIVCVGMPWLLHNLFTVIFEHKNMASYLRKLFFYCVIVLLSCFASYSICSFVNTSLVASIVIRGIVCCIVPNTIYFFAYRNTEEYQCSLVVVNNMTKGKFARVLRKLGMY